MFRNDDTTGLGSLCTPEGICCPCQEMRQPLDPLRCLLAPAYQCLWLVTFNDASDESSLVLTFPATLAPNRSGISSHLFPSRMGGPSCDGGYIVGAL